MPVTKLLIVDDESAPIKALCDALEPEGYAASRATTAEAALAILREQVFDLVLTDLVMPGMDGIEFLRSAREIDPDLVGIVIADVGTINAADQAMRAGALDYVNKPFNISAILPVLARARSVRHLRLENIHLQQAVGIYELSMVIQLTLDFDAVLQKVADAAISHAQVDGVSVLLPVEEGRALRVAVTRGDGVTGGKRKSLPFGKTLSRWVERSLKRVSRLNELAHSQTPLPLSLTGLPGSTSVPMLSGGRFIGILNVTSRHPGRPVSTAQTKALNILANAAASALEGASLLEQIRSAERHYRSLAESAVDIIFHYELYPRPHVGYINPAVNSITGYTPEEHYGDPELILKIVHPDDRNLMEKVLRGDYSSGSAVTIRYIHRDGTSTKWIEECITQVRDPEGRLVAIEGIGRDVTERRSLEEQLRQSQKMEAIGLLAGGVAHDFNNLLTVIIGYSDLILVDDLPADRISYRIVQVKKAAEQAAALTRQLLAFGRRQIVQYRVLNLNSVVSSSLKILQRVVGEDLQLITRLDAELGAIKGDPGQIEQVLMNLAVNARGAMPQGGKVTIETQNVTLEGAYAIRTRVADPGAYVMLAVSDTGCGMDAAQQAKIFEPFYTTKESGRGTGLGLSIVYGIVKQSGGYIRVISQRNEGARFELLFPRTEEALDSCVLAPERKEQAMGSETILVVEDDPGVSQLIAIILRIGGYEVLMARDGEEALRISAEREGKIELILTDLILPGITGTALVSTLKPFNAGMRVLFMSGYADDMVANHGKLDPAIPFIQKPFSPANLIGKVREVLDGIE